MSDFWPKEIRIGADRRRLTVAWDDGRSDELAAHYLRVESPSAEVQGHGPGERKVVTGRENVAISAVDPVGSYAIRITFDDGHSTGIFSWPYLRMLADEHETRAERHRSEVAALGR